MMNVVEEKIEELFEAAKEKNMGVKFTQTNHGRFSCRSSVVLYAGKEPRAYRDASVVHYVSFNQSALAGTTTRCARYRAVQELLEYIHAI